MSKLTIEPGFIMLDVKKGRAALHRTLNQGKAVTLNAVITLEGSWGNDDGMSQEFHGEVNSFEITSIGGKAP